MRIAPFSNENCTRLSVEHLRQLHRGQRIRAQVQRGQIAKLQHRDQRLDLVQRQARLRQQSFYPRRLAMQKLLRQRALLGRSCAAAPDTDG